MQRLDRRRPVCGLRRRDRPVNWHDPQPQVPCLGYPLNVDPVDDCTFWYTTEYLRNNGAFNWSTQIASFKYPGCI